MPYKMTGLGAFGLSVDWERIDGDEATACRLVAFLEDRRLLFGPRHCKDELHCVRSALEIRAFLTNEIANGTVGRSLSASLRAMRAGCRAFVEAAGPDGCNFRHRDAVNTDWFSLALGEMRALFGVQLAVVAASYDLDVEPELRTIMPPATDDDGAPLDWMPGF